MMVQPKVQYQAQYTSWSDESAVTGIEAEKGITSDAVTTWTDECPWKVFKAEADTVSRTDTYESGNMDVDII